MLAIGCILAKHGADVLLVNAFHLQNTMSFVTDTGHGKRSVYLDLTKSGASTDAMWAGN
ncbi:hypothetical protein KSC_030660 [Ktedonobacter sp. SOSP1-52]|nr:hypothetical protein KSC_030660 [Ktedonobacter sp. SOSP1-52]